MNQEEAIKNVYNALLSETSIPVSIRNMEGVDKVQYEELKRILSF
ncbi:hypothetical protein [Flavobacterium davisii]|nr:hypothetical protein [Flavobacterium davisii]